MKSLSQTQTVKEKEANKTAKVNADKIFEALLLTLDYEEINFEEFDLLDERERAEYEKKMKELTEAKRIHHVKPVGADLVEATLYEKPDEYVVTMEIEDENNNLIGRIFHIPK